MIAILGAGDIGAAVAERLVFGGRASRVLLVDESAGVATGKALDIAQAAPVVGSDVPIAAAADVLAAARARVVIVADRVAGGEWRDGDGEQMLDRLLRAGSDAALVFAGPNQIGLLEATRRRLNASADRLVATAAAAMAGAARSLVGAELDLSATDVSITIAGRPPALVIAWSSATIAGAPALERLPAHRMLAISAQVTRLWPPGPQAIAAATMPVAGALAGRSRRRLAAMALSPADGAPRDFAEMTLLELGHGRVLSGTRPVLSPLERVSLGY